MENLLDNMSDLHKTVLSILIMQVFSQIIKQF